MTIESEEFWGLLNAIDKHTDETWKQVYRLRLIDYCNRKLQEARMEERGRCAEICDKVWYASMAAQAIRSLPEEE